MNRFGHRLGWVFAVLLCAALVMIPPQAAETEKSESKKDSGKPAKESELVKASREIQSKKTGTAKTYGNDDLQQGEPPKTKVYTTDDLVKRFGQPQEAQASSEPGATTEPGAPADMPDPLALMEQEKKAQASREQAVAEAEAKLAAAQEKLKNLEVQLLATRNPFSARPELSEEEQKLRATSGETAAERNARTQKLVEEAKQEIAKAEAELQRARSP